MDTENNHAAMRESFSLVQNILLIDCTDILPAHLRENMVEKLWESMQFTQPPCWGMVVRVRTTAERAHCRAAPLPSYGSSKLHYSFQSSLLAAVAVAALCLIVYYCHENHLFHPHLGVPPKWDSCTTKMGQDRPRRHYK